MTEIIQIPSVKKATSGSARARAGAAPVDCVIDTFASLTAFLPLSPQAIEWCSRNLDHGTRVLGIYWLDSHDATDAAHGMLAAGHVLRIDGVPVGGRVLSC